MKFNEAGEPTVLVNNMNTRLPVVHIPQNLRTRQSLQFGGSNWDRNAPSVPSISDPKSNRPTVAESEKESEASFSPKRKTILENGDELHANLEDVYKRVMRRLQREYNYDVDRVPLETQFGIRAAHEQVDLSPLPTSAEFEMDIDTQSAVSSTKFVAAPAGLELSKGKPSQNKVLTYRLEKEKGKPKDAADELERSLEQQPCPETLRLVLEQVTEVLVKKMEFAERGSLKDAFRFTFECKALLERVLKEIPDYSTFQGNAESLSTTEKGNRAVQLQELYNKFRKQPVMMRKAEYARDASTGAVVSVLQELPPALSPHSTRKSDDPDRSPVKASFAEKSLSPKRVSSPKTTRAMTEHYSALAKDIIYGDDSVDIDEREIELPRGYGKSARIYGKPMDSTRIDSMMQSHSQLVNQSSFQMRSDKHVEDLSVNKLWPRTTESPMSPMNGSMFPLGKSASSFTVGRGNFSPHGSRAWGRKNEFSPIRSQAYQAKLVSVGTITDDNSTNIVTRETHNKLLAYTKELETKVAQAERGMNEALEKVLREKNHNEFRNRVIRYLRETVFRECNLLRTQLSMAEQKETMSGTARSIPNTTRKSVLETPMSSRSRVNTHMRIASSDPSSPSAEVNKVQSLLDLALLAVESEGVLSRDEWNLEVLPGEKSLRHPMQDLDNVIAAYENRQQALKERIISMRVEHSFVLAEKETEIAALRRLNNLSFVRATLLSYVKEVKQDVLRTKNMFMGLLEDFQVALTESFDSLHSRISLSKTEVQDYENLKHSHEALVHLVHSAHNLFLPMLTNEYSHGYHPWPTKLRNTINPLAQVLQTTFGENEVTNLRKSLTLFSDLYIAIHQFVVSTVVVPNISHPVSGKALQQLCSGMVLSPLASIDLVYNIRLRYDKEIHLRKQIAKLNFKILWIGYYQVMLTERCVASLLEGQMDPHSCPLPVSRRVNKMAETRTLLSRDRASLQKERNDNVKELYRMWRDRQIDIFEGYATPRIQNRIAVLNTAQISETRYQFSAVRTQASGSKLKIGFKSQE